MPQKRAHPLISFLQVRKRKLKSTPKAQKSFEVPIWVYTVLFKIRGVGHYSRSASPSDFVIMT